MQLYYALPQAVYLSFSMFAGTDSVKPVTWSGKLVTIQVGLFVVIIVSACMTTRSLRFLIMRTTK